MKDEKCLLNREKRDVDRKKLNEKRDERRRKKNCYLVEGDGN